MHLNADELVDLADGARPESSAPHLATCEECRAQLGDLRAMMSAVADVDVPEPSPLFWDHFSQRVHQAVGAEDADARLKGSRSVVPGVRSIVLRVRSFALEILGARAFQASVVAIATAALVILVVLPSRLLSPSAPPQVAYVAAPPPPAGADVNTSTEVVADALDSDPSLALVASLTTTLDADGTSETGLARVGSAAHAVTHMNGADLRELHRLLQEEMAP